MDTIITFKRLWVLASAKRYSKVIINKYLHGKELRLGNGWKYHHDGYVDVELRKSLSKKWHSLDSTGSKGVGKQDTFISVLSNQGCSKVSEEHKRRLDKSNSAHKESSGCTFLLSRQLVGAAA